MTLTGEQAREVVWLESPEWKPVEGTIKTTGHSRWSVHKEQIFEHVPTGAFYRFKWSVGAPGYQHEDPFQWDNEYAPREVRLVERVAWVWEVLEPPASPAAQGEESE